MPSIEVKHLRKVYRVVQKEAGVRGALKGLVRPHYSDKVAVDDLSFSISAGEIVGFIGVNGAGKSTTIKMLTGILQPSSGEVRVLGRDPHRQRVANAREIGVVFGQRTQLWWDLALIESLDTIARLYDIPPAVYQQRLKEFSETLELEALFKTPVRSLSLGQKMRAELAATLLHAPKVVYLDEPTIGLDVVVKDRIRAFIRQQNHASQTTVMLTTHDLGDIEELCQRVIIIDDGKLLYDGALAMIKDRFGTHRRIHIEASSLITALAPLPAGVEIEQQVDYKLSVRFDRTRHSASQVLAWLVEQVEVRDFSLSEPDLTGIIKQIYQGALDVTTTMPQAVAEVSL
jgi:ABC-2 type transport system ATP-binding protein